MRKQDSFPRTGLRLPGAHVRIPMLGQKRSINVATAGGAVLYELLRKWRDLSPEQRTREE